MLSIQLFSLFYVLFLLSFAIVFIAKAFITKNNKRTNRNINVSKDEKIFYVYVTISIIEPNTFILHVFIISNP